MKVKIYSDGASRGNPGVSAIAFMILTEDDKLLKQSSAWIGVQTNNQTEYRALITALKTASDLHVQEATCYSDSELVVKQLTGQYRVRNANLRPLWITIQTLQQSFQKISFIHVTRDNPYIREVDKLANQTLNRFINRQRFEL